MNHRQRSLHHYWNNMNISVFGLGYVGAVSCGCLAELGHNIIGVDVNVEKVERIKSGESPVLELGLDEMIKKAVKNGTLTATTDADEAVAQSDAALVCVGTPSTPSGGVNSIYLEQVAEQIGKAVAKHQPEFFLVLNRSTSLVPIHHRLQEILVNSSGREIGNGIGYVCHPEFLREGAAVDDFFNPPKIVFGTSDEESATRCEQLYPGIEAPSFVVSPEVASMIKYADNCFHAVKVTFANEIGTISRQYGIDATDVMEVFCQDTKLNISRRYLRPGTPFGGSCLPKDLRGILDAARETATSMPMLSGVLQSNQMQVESLMRRIVSPQRPSVGIIGLAFKEHTDDVRESPLVTLVELVSGKGHAVKIYDAHLAPDQLTGANKSFALQSIPHLSDLLSKDLQAVINESDILVINHSLTPDDWKSIEWPTNIRIIDLSGVEELMNQPGYEGIYW